jgi:NifU-like protein involved in Fe-S cluster formation
MDDPYSAEVRRRFAAPLGAGRPPAGAAGWTSGSAEEPASGTRICVHLRQRAGRVEELRYEVFGCPHTIAALAWIAELVARGELRNLTIDLQGIAAALGIPPEKLGRLLAIEDAIRDAAGAKGLIEADGSL